MVYAQRLAAVNIQILVARNLVMQTKIKLITTPKLNNLIITLKPIHKIKYSCYNSSWFKIFQAQMQVLIMKIIPNNHNKINLSTTNNFKVTYRVRFKMDPNSCWWIQIPQMAQIKHNWNQIIQIQHLMGKNNNNRWLRQPHNSFSCIHNNKYFSNNNNWTIWINWANCKCLEMLQEPQGTNNSANSISFNYFQIISMTWFSTNNYFNNNNQLTKNQKT